MSKTADGDFRQNQPPPIMTGMHTGNNQILEDEEYEEASYQKQVGNSDYQEHEAQPNQDEDEASDVDGDEALLDLEQLEELHSEAERMKALGNKHMASQEYTRAYNAYSAALQLSPVGPSSHVFLSNRAAALLSLKRYAAAATDARRAIALAPTFGKAHARLGQSLYFLKDYEGAVSAYEEAIHYEPDNKVTVTYLEKAKAKLIKQQERAARAARGEEVTVAPEDATVAGTIANSIATDPNQSAAVVTSGFRGSSDAIMRTVGKEHPREISTVQMQQPATQRTALNEVDENTSEMPDEEDPDFDEAVKIQQRANSFLADKQYKRAIEEYSAALFLVPDDPYLSPELHLGRAHALNGSRRHESARNDAQLALKMQPSAEAYSTLAKSLFYLKDYNGAVDAFTACIDLLPEGESLSMFDQAYLQKAEAALAEQIETNPDRLNQLSGASTVPKLPPPRFVSRQEAISSTQNMPPDKKRWPQQSPRSPSSLQCGPERTVTFLSESLGIKLNRGTDGIVRVLAVLPDTPGSPVARSGDIFPGDVVREAAGVDIRRPITNIMWGDTVALIKLAPRPIVFVVAEELSKPPPSVLEERRKASEEESEIHQ